MIDDFLIVCLQHAGTRSGARYFPADNEHPGKLKEEQIRHYNEKGYIFPLDAFTPAEADSHRAYFDQLMKMATAAWLNGYSING